MNRRHFALGALSAWSAARVIGANDRVRMGLIGSGGRGREDWDLPKQPEVEPAVWTCTALPRQRHRDDGGRAKPVKDFRRCWNSGYRRRDRGYARSLARADHSGGLRAADVYCEKPLSSPTGADAQPRASQCVVQTGGQQRSGRTTRLR
jgi:hypothetical protein